MNLILRSTTESLSLPSLGAESTITDMYVSVLEPWLGMGYIWKKPPRRIDGSLGKKDGVHRERSRVETRIDRGYGHILPFPTHMIQSPESGFLPQRWDEGQVTDNTIRMYLSIDRRLPDEPRDNVLYDRRSEERTYIHRTR